MQTATECRTPVDASEAARTLCIFLPPGQVTELRALDACVGRDRWKQTWAGFFEDHEALIKAMRLIQSASGIYITLNPVNPELLNRAVNRLRPAKEVSLTTDKDILRRRWLLVDCDPVRPDGVSSTEDEHDAAIDRAMAIRDALGAEAWPSPVLADSGNGGHLLYPIDHPANDDELVKRCLQTLDARFSDGRVKIDAKVFNPSRIVKLYGTLACKGDDTATRPHRISKIIEVPT